MPNPPRTRRAPRASRASARARVERAVVPRFPLACAAISLTALGANLAGCAGGVTEVEYARPYPEANPRALTLDIQVFRSTSTIELTNTTARAFGPSTLWLNARFSRPIDGLAVGQTLTMPLSEFRDRHSDAFRGGGFFAPDDPERLVLAELESPGDDGAPVMHRLIVVGGEVE